MAAKLKFEYGIEYKGFTYGWLLSELWRLPSKSGNRTYPLKKLTPSKTKHGTVYYRLKRDKVLMPKLEHLTKEINVEVDYVRKNKHVPF